MHSLIRSLALAAAVTAAVIDIDVGEGGITFNPKSTTAKVGDTLAFHFYAGTGPHSVVRAAFDSPCVPAQDAFFSGYDIGTASGDDQVFEVAVTSTDPIWFYCSEKRHCQNGMVGVVNPPSGSTIDDFANAAKSVAAASAPASLTGGTSTSLASGSNASSTSSSAPTSATSSGAGTSVTSAASSAASGASSASSKASSVASAASTAATSTPTNSGAIQKDGKAAAALAMVAGGLVALMA